MRITFLSDNIGEGGLEGEWGLSVFIEYRDRRVLLDAGASDLFLANAEKLGIDLDRIDFAVLSHGHYDHGNGFIPFFEKNRKAKLYLRSCCCANCWKMDEEDQPKYIGIPPQLTEDYEDRLIRVDRDLSPAEGVFLVPHKTPGLDRVGLRERMYLRIGDRFEADDFGHEQSLVFETGEGLVIFNSCSHAGASLIIREVEETFPGKKIYGMIGGFHLFNKTEEEDREFARRLRESGVEMILTGHCTGDEAFLILREELGDRVGRFHAGLVLELAD